MIRIYGELPKIRVRKLPKDPEFSKYVLDFKAIERVSRKYKKFKNVVVIGNGGSINSFRAIAKALRPKKNVFFVDTMEPEILEDVTKKCKPKDTVIIPISKSGNTLGVLEELLYFVDKGYRNVVAVTGGGALMEIVKRMKWDCVIHPNIGGRFAGMTSCALLPSSICGLNVRSIYSGARKIYNSSRAKKKLYELAKALFYLEKNGYNEIFMPVYSELLEGFIWIITQLIHETTGKNELGQTIVAALAPESQHHTNQRFFGGPRDMIGFFIVVKNHKVIKIRVPKKLADIPLRDESLSIIDNLDLSKAINYEFEGVVKTTSEKKIPYVVMELDKLNEKSVGELLAIWQYIAYYSAVLRGQNPFDQPEVERSKEITFELIKNLNGRKKN